MSEKIEVVLSLSSNFEEKLKGASSASDKFTNKMSGMSKSVDNIGGMIAGAFSIGAIASFGKASIDVLAKYENFEARMTTALGDRTAAQMAMNNIQKDAVSTPFDVASLTESNALLISAGESAGGARKATMDLANAIAATGGGSDELSRMAVNMQQIKSLGKATALDVKQFAFAGIPIYKMLSKSMGKTVDQLKDMDITYEQLTKSMAEARKEGGMFFQGLENGMQTVGGKISNLGDAWEQLQKTIAESQRGIIASTIDWATSAINTMTNVMKNRDQMSKSFEKYGAKDYSLGERAKDFYFDILGKFKGQKMDTRYQDALNKNYVEPSLLSLSDAVKSKQKLTQLIVNYGNDEEEKKDMVQFNRTMATIRGTLDAVQGNIDNFRADKKKTDDKKDTLKIEKKKLDETSKIKGNNYTQITINIDKMIEMFKVETTNMRESSVAAAEIVLKGLATAINDATIIATG